MKVIHIAYENGEKVEIEADGITNITISEAIPAENDIVLHAEEVNAVIEPVGFTETVTVEKNATVKETPAVEETPVEAPVIAEEVTAPAEPEGPVSVDVPIAPADVPEPVDVPTAPVEETPVAENSVMDEIVNLVLTEEEQTPTVSEPEPEVEQVAVATDTNGTIEVKPAEGPTIQFDGA